MLNRKFVISVAAMFVLSLGLGMLIHGGILHDEYAKLPNLMRPEAEAQKMMGLMMLAQFCIALGFTWLYTKGREAKPWLGQGVRFGIATAVLMTIPMYLIYYVVMPFPSDLVAQQIVFDTIGMVVMGIVLAWINR